MSERKLDHGFIFRCRRPIDDMRRAGMNDVIIGWVIYEIRAAAIQEERLRLEIVTARNPPNFNVTGFDIADQIGEAKADAAGQGDGDRG